MAELNVQPKSGRPWWLWLLIALVGMALLFFLLRSCDRQDEDVRDTREIDTTDTTTTAYPE